MKKHEKHSEEWLLGYKAGISELYEATTKALSETIANSAFAPLYNQWRQEYDFVMKNKKETEDEQV